MSSWTDQNDADPGVTMLGLFAWLALGLFFALVVYVYRTRDRELWHSIR